MWLKLFKLAKRSLRTIFNARGGGLYACGFVVTFVYLEIRMFVLDIVEADTVGNFITGQIAEKLFRYFTESIGNTIQAFIWPVDIVRFQPPWGIAILLGMYLVFSAFIKKPLQGWLFDDEPESSSS